MKLPLIPCLLLVSSAAATHAFANTNSDIDNTEVSVVSTDVSQDMPIETNDDLKNDMIEQETFLPLDENIVSGTLENGLNYIIRALPDNGARPSIEMNLIINAGSAHETDEQLGYAHFVEHMAFNGSKNYPKNALIDFFQRSGMNFGQDLNAYTSFEETVYQLTIPHSKPELMDTAFDVVNDWLFNLNFAEAQVESEIGIVLEEWRLRDAGEKSIYQQWFDWSYADDHFGHRLPIGTQKSIQSANAEQLKAFYQTWYHPENATVVVTGVFDDKKIEQQLKSAFTQRASERFNPVTLSATAARQQTLINFQHSQQNSLNVGFFSFDRNRNSSNLSELKADINKMLLDTLFDIRLSKRSQQASSPFNQASGSTNSKPGQLVEHRISVNATSAESLDAAIIALEVERLYLLQDGVTQAEVDQAMAQLISQFTLMSRQFDNAPASVWSNFLVYLLSENEPLITLASFVEFASAQKGKISAEQINELAQEKFSRARTWFVFSNKDSQHTALDDKRLTQLLAQAPSALIKKRDNKASIAKKSNHRKTYSIKVNPDAKLIDVTRSSDKKIEKLLLNNGLEVYLLPSDLEPGRVNVRFSHDVGLRQMPLEIRPYANLWMDVRLQTGLMNKDKVDFDLWLTEQQMSVSGGFYRNSFSIDTDGNSESIDQNLSVIHHLLTEPLKDNVAFTQIRDDYLQRTTAWRKSPHGKYFAQYQQALWAQQAPYLMLAPHYFSDMTLQNYQNISPWFFAKDANARMIITGDFDAQLVKQAVKDNFGGFEFTEIKERKSLTATLSKSQINVIKESIDPREDINHVLRVPSNENYNARQSALRLVFENMLNKQLTEDIREKNSLVYSIGSRVTAPNQSQNFWQLDIYYSLEPDNRKKTVALVNDNLEQFLDRSHFKPAEVKQAIERTHSALNQYFVNNKAFTQYLDSALGYQRSIDDAFSVQQIMPTLTEQEVADFAQKILSAEHRYLFVLAPK
jgi:zinc protease